MIYPGSPKVTIISPESNPPQITFLELPYDNTNVLQLVNDQRVGMVYCSFARVG